MTDKEFLDLLMSYQAGKVPLVQVGLAEYSCAMKSQFRKQGNHESGTGNHALVVQCLNLFA